MQAETLKWIKSYKSPNFILGTCYLYADKKKKKKITVVITIIWAMKVTSKQLYRALLYWKSSIEAFTCESYKEFYVLKKWNSLMPLSWGI